MIRTRHILFVLLVASFLAPRTLSQTPPATGTPRFNSFSSGPADIVNLGNLNAHVTIPVFSRAGRGIPFNYNLQYDSSIWYPVTASGTTTWTPVQNWGLLAQTAVATGYLGLEFFSYNCLTYIPISHTWAPTGYTSTYRWHFYVDSLGGQHPLEAISTLNWGSCNGASYPPSQDATAIVTDGSGYTLNATHNGLAEQVSITTKDGTITYPPWNTNGGATTYTDRNGNRISVDASGNFTDTLGTVALAVAGSGTPASPATLTYKAPGPTGAGVSVSAAINYKSYTVATNFGISSIHEFGATAVSLPDNVTLADGTKYIFAYEPTPSTPSAGACTPLTGTDPATCVTARLKSATLPTGGIISYTYTGGYNGVFSDGTVPTLTRQTPDGTWTYARSQVSGSHWQTVVTDSSASANQTVIQFQGLYETQRQTYQGSSATGILLQTVNTCFNAAASPCTTTAITLPISRVTQLVALPDNTGKVCKHDRFFNTYGLMTEQDDYDYGSGAPASTALRKSVTTYNTALTNGIVGMPASVKIQDGSGITVGETDFAYDEGTISAPTGTTPQHISITGSRGNATTIKQLIQGTTFLTSTISYWDTGNPKTATDVNGAQTTVNYPDATSTCGNAFPTSITEPLSLSRNMTWNCVGGVLTQITDENSQATTTAFSDPYFWRPASVTDPSSAVTNLTYTNATTSESSLSFNSSNSVIDVLSTLDGLGRSLLRQQKQSPGATSYDSVETDYDALGRPKRTTLPYNASAGGLASGSAPATTTTYDAMSRPAQVSDSGGGSTLYYYSQNDTLITVSPAPTGENTKRRQMEYDALGRLTSVCEVTSATGSGSCTQSVARTGYWTKYTYNPLGKLTGVTQNAQAMGSTQSRSYSYDGLGRLTSETNPENGVTSYTYDTIASGNCAGTYNGDLLKKVDAVGNVTCTTYDLLHRPLTITYPAGTYAASTPSKNFVYDTATVNSVSMTNAKTRLAQAYTCSSPCTTKLTDEGFNYTARGEISDVYQSTPHSSGYYHVPASYWAHGAVNQLNALPGNTPSLPGLPILTYNVDGEGRVSGTSSSSGQNPVTSTTYSPYATPPSLAVTLGSGDSDSFTFDANTGRMIQYKANIGTGGLSITGNLTWNANGSLQQLAITDQFNAADTQTCNYVYDDLSRIGGANCGTAAAQTFSYDAFGNINKSGSPNSFTPTYSTASNRMASLPGFTPTYDANGNVTADSNHTYSWDSNGNSISIDSVGLTFDALDRMVEQNRSGAYTQIVYDPTGAKLALMNGQTLVKGFVPLPGQAIAVYTSSGLDHYRHPDWLGSARVTSSASRAFLSSVAYAPFGEPYASSGTQDLSFTGQNQDTVSGDYDFLFREYSTQGRWVSPDPAGLAAVDATNPQSWNRYSYVNDDPTNTTDPLGLCGETAFGPYDFSGCRPQDYVNYPGLYNYPCFGIAGYYRGGCPKIPPPPTIGPPPPPKQIKTCSLKDYLNAGFDFGFGLGLGVEAGLIKADVSWWRSEKDNATHADASAGLLTVQFEASSSDPTGHWDLDEHRASDTADFQYGPYKYDTLQGKWRREGTTFFHDVFLKKYGFTGLIMKFQFDFAKAEKWAADNGCDAIDW